MAGERTPSGAWIATTMLLLLAVINYADRSVVGLAAVPIMIELHLTPKEFGFLGSSFFFLFSLSAIFIGFLASRFPARWMILGLILSWSLVQIPMIGTVGFATLVACRILLGAGEGPGLSVSAHALYKWFPDAERALPTAIVAQGSSIGVLVALPTLNWIIIRYSWHWAFGALGLIGVIWAFAWFYIGEDGPLKESELESHMDASKAYRHLLMSTTFIGCCIACFSAYWALSLGLTWFTPFIVRGLGYSQASAGWLSALPWAMGSVVMLVTGWMSQRSTAAGIATPVARGVLGSAPLLIGGLILLMVPYIGTAPFKIAALVVGASLTGAIYVVCPPILSEIAPVSGRVAVLAVFSAIYTIAGIVAPMLSGAVIESAATELDGYYNGYRITALVQIVGGICGLFILGRPHKSGPP
jgi:MFS family permease